MSHALWLSEFRALGVVAAQTRAVLAHCRPPRPLTEAQRRQLDATLRHLAAVREGFQLSLRWGSGDPTELQAIVRYTLSLIDWSFLASLGISLEAGQALERPDEQLLAWGHAMVAFAVLPQLPPGEVSHPTSSHYRDLGLPQRPGEWLERIEELEGVLARLQAGARQPLSPPALRRTHAYFDATAWLVREHLQRFGRD